MAKQDAESIMEEYDAGISRFSRHLPKSDDLSLIVLKGHLLAEAELNELLGALLAKPGPYMKAKPSWPQRVALAEALIGSSQSVWWLAALRRLNSIRNEMAHQLEPCGLEDQIARFCELVEPEAAKQVFRAVGLSKRLKLSLGLLCGQIGRIRALCRE